MREWVERRLGSIVEAKNGQELRVDCPFCFARTGTEDTKKHLYISTVKPKAHCFRCEWGGYHISLIMSVEGCSYTQAIEYITSPPTDIGKFDDLYSPRGLVKADPLLEMPEGFLPMHYDRPHDIGVEYKAVWNYLKWRLHGDIDLMVERFGYVPGTHRAWVLVDKHWWQGRLIIPGEPKYLSPPWPKGDSLWNVQALDLYRSITICEGVFSAIAVGNNAVALCGKAANDEQLYKIIDSGVEELIIALDSDALDYSYQLGDRLRWLGYDGDLKVQEMLGGDPDGGRFGKLLPWSWEKVVSHRLSNISAC